MFLYNYIIGIVGTPLCLFSLGHLKLPYSLLQFDVNVFPLVEVILDDSSVYSLECVFQTECDGCMFREEVTMILGDDTQIGICHLAP